MGRLTKRDEYGNADIIGVDSADLHLNLDFEEMNKVTEALNRLAELEDKIERDENGKLKNTDTTANNNGKEQSEQSKLTNWIGEEQVEQRSGENNVCM